MSNETKRDVFLQIAKENRDLRMYDPDAIEPKELIEQDYQDWIREYDAALPDDLPVIPKEIGEYIERQKQGSTLRSAIIAATDFHAVDDEEADWIFYHSDTFARAWVLGVWRV